MGQELKAEISVREIEQSLDTLISRPYIDEQLRVGIAGAAVVLLPREETAEGPLFPAGTIELYRDLQAKLSPSRVEIATHDGNYREILLHSILIDLGIIFATYALIPMLPNALWDFVKQKTGIMRDKKNTEVRLRLLVANGTQDQSMIEINYEGSAEDLSKIATEIGKLSARPNAQALAEGEPKDMQALLPEGNARERTKDEHHDS